MRNIVVEGSNVVVVAVDDRPTPNVNMPREWRLLGRKWKRGGLTKHSGPDTSTRAQYSGQPQGLAGPLTTVCKRDVMLTFAGEM